MTARSSSTSSPRSSAATCSPAATGRWSARSLGAAIMAMSQIGIPYAELEPGRPLHLPRRRAPARRAGQQLHPPQGAGGSVMNDTPALLELRNISKYFGNVTALRGHLDPCARRQGDVRARRQRRRQVDVHQDPVGTAPPERPASTSSTVSRCTSTRLARRAQPGIATVYQDLAMAPLMSVWRNFFLGVGTEEGLRPDRLDGHRRSPSGRPRTRCRRWGSTSATSTSRSARCPVASGSRSRSRARCTSAHAC